MTVTRTTLPAAGFAALLRPLRRCLVALVLAACALVAVPGLAQAAPYNTTATVPVTVTYESDTTPDVRSPACTVVLTPEDGRPGDAQTLTVTPAQTQDFRGEGSGSFSVELPGLGTYEYTLKHTTAAQNGWTLDAAVYDVTIQVLRDEATDQPRVIVRIMKDGAKFDAAEFANRYAAAWPEGRAPAVKAHKALGVKRGGAVTDEKADLAAGAYTFQLKDAAGAVVATATNDADGLVAFAPLVHDKTGVYRYTLSEVKGKDANTEYDERTVRVTVTVTDDGDGGLVGTVAYDGSGQPPTFQNFLLKVSDPGAVVRPSGGTSFRGFGGTPTTGDPLTDSFLYLALGALVALAAALVVRKVRAQEV